MSEKERGVVTFLFTDVEGSTRLWEADPRKMSDALRRHDTLLHAAIDAAGGTVFKTVGDSFCTVFLAPGGAIEAAVAIQRGLIGAKGETHFPLRVRIAIHAGEAERRAGDYFGPALNRVARLLAAAHGQQVLVSRAASDFAHGRLPPGISLHDLGEHTLKDLQQRERVYQVQAEGLPAEFPPLRAGRHLPRNVPQPTMPLIGREREVALARLILGLARPEDDVSAAHAGDFQQPARLLTLTGPGGAGKTRLSLHLAAELSADFGDGAVFSPLAELTEPELIPGAILASLNLGETTGGTPHDLLLDELREKHLLLILDNFEQVMGAVNLVAELLACCPRLQILVTSRERLNLRGEQELPLPPLALPEPIPRTVPLPEADAVAEAARAVDAIGRSAAVRLFVQRARSVNPDFALTAENAQTVADICARLDGLPLAIELAAARLRLLSPQALLDRFDRRFDVLNRGPRDLPARQKTMRDTIAWSYDLLDPNERQLFTHLSIFAGGATQAAVAAVVGTPEDDEFEDLELLESLADKSLVRLSTNADEPRVVMLQTIRDFGQERLLASGEHEAIGRRHAAYYLDLAETNESLLAGIEQTRSLDRLDRDQANLRAAIGWLREHGHVEDALRLSSALWRFWWLRGDISEGRQQLESLLAECAVVAPEQRAKALNAAGVLAESQGDRETAARLHQESLEIARRVGDLHSVAWSLNNLGVVAINEGDYERARAILEENLAVAEQMEDPASVATALIDLGQIAIRQDDHERATALISRSLRLFRELGDESHMARALNNLGSVAFQAGEMDRARSLLEESLALHRSVGDRQGIASTLNNLAGVADSQGDADTAMSLFLESHMLALDGGNQLYAAIAMENLAALTLHQGETQIAQIRFREALRLYRVMGDQQGIVSCLIGLASLAQIQGHAAQAATLLGTAAANCGEHPHLTPDAAEVADSLRRALGDGPFDDAWRAGQAMSIDDVIDQVLIAAR